MGKKTWIPIVLLLGAINLLLFWPGSLFFLNDDFIHIPLTTEGKFFQTNSIRPLHELLVKLDLLLYGKQAYGFHITALLLHGIVCFQLYNLCFAIQTNWLKADRAKATNTAFLATALFLIYPQHTESLAWVLGRTPVLSAVFLMFVLRFFFDQKITVRHYFLGFVFFSATLFTYEQSILLPAILFWLACMDKGQRKQKMTYTFCLSLAAVIYIIARKIITADIVGSYEGGNFITRNWPHLIANTGRLITRLWLNPSTVGCYKIATAVSICVLGFLFFTNRKKIATNRNTLLFILGSIILLIIPIISLGITIRSYESGRYLYMPSIFLAMGIAMFCGSFFSLQKQSIKFLLPLLLILVCYWGWGKYQSASHYRNASQYVLQTQNEVFKQSAQSAEPVIIDTLKLTVHRIPVFRMGFNRGLKWINPAIDTNRITVKYYYDEFTDPTLK